MSDLSKIAPSLAKQQEMKDEARNKGPWRMESGQIWQEEENHPDETVVFSAGEYEFRYDDPAVVALICAAPDLLKAAKEALKFIQTNGLAHGRSLAAAISKAEGR